MKKVQNADSSDEEAQINLFATGRKDKVALVRLAEKFVNPNKIPCDIQVAPVYQKSSEKSNSLDSQGAPQVNK